MRVVGACIGTVSAVRGAGRDLYCSRVGYDCPSALRAARVAMRVDTRGSGVRIVRPRCAVPGVLGCRGDVQHAKPRRTKRHRDRGSQGRNDWPGASQGSVSLGREPARSNDALRSRYRARGSNAFLSGDSYWRSKRTVAVCPST